MVAPTSTKLFQLRLGVESGERQQDGVIVVTDIPVGAIVHARVDRPTEFPTESDLVPAPTQVVSSGGRTLTFADANPDTLTASSGSFLTDGYRPGMLLIVGGTSSNDGIYPILNVTATVITVDLSGATFTAEGPISGGETLDGAPGLVQLYKFELAPPPAAFTAGGVTFNRDAFGAVPPYVPSGAGPSSMQRVIVAPGGGVGGSGRPVVTQVVPAWANFSPYVGGFLKQKGKLVHTLSMPGQAGLTPELDPSERNFLRMRWVGVPVSGATLVAASADTFVSGTWASDHENLVPGSISLTLPTSAGTLLDDGKGRLVGADGDGTVNYLTGEYSLNFNAAETGNVLATYEHDCLYRPLDVNLTYDPLQAQ